MPPELLRSVLEYLDAGDLATLLRVNKRLCFMVTTHEKRFAQLLCPQQHERIQSTIDSVDCAGGAVVTALHRYLRAFGPIFEEEGRLQLYGLQPEDVCAEHYCSNVLEPPAGLAYAPWVNQVGDLVWLLWFLHCYQAAPTEAHMEGFTSVFPPDDSALLFGNRAGFVHLVCVSCHISFVWPAEVGRMHHQVKGGDVFGRPTAVGLDQFRCDTRPRTFEAWRDSMYGGLAATVIGTHGKTIPGITTPPESSLCLFLMRR